MGWDCVWHRALSPSVTLAPFPKASWNHSLTNPCSPVLPGVRHGWPGSPSPRVVLRTSWWASEAVADMLA